MSIEPTTLELRRAAKRAMFRAFPKHHAGWNLDTLIKDGHQHPKVKEATAPQHSTGWNPKRERHDIYMQGQAAKGKHRRNAKHRGAAMHPTQEWRLAS